MPDPTDLIRRADAITAAAKVKQPPYPRSDAGEAAIYAIGFTAGRKAVEAALRALPAITVQEPHSRAVPYSDTVEVCPECDIAGCVHIRERTGPFAPSPGVTAGATGTFQNRVHPWMQACFGPEVSADRLERGDRLLEEVFELLQSGGYPRERVASLIGYVWSRPAGEPAQEVGGVMVTLAAYCLAHELDMHSSGETELARIWTKVEAIRAKQAAKPKGSPLPQEWPTPAPVVPAEGLDALIGEIVFETVNGEIDRALAGRIITALRSAPPVVARVTGWQPIETAPKDGTSIIATTNEYAEPLILRWLMVNGRWAWRDWDTDSYINVTHWMPLPEPPAALLPAGEGE